MTEHTDAELCAMLAEEMGATLVRSVETFETRAFPFYWIEDGICKVVWSKASAWQRFDPINSWDDFGKVWEWAVESGYQIVLQPSLAKGDHIFLVWHSGSDPRPCMATGPNPRRALVLAVLKARGRIE